MATHPVRIVTVDQGEILIDGEPLTVHPYGKAMAGQTLFYPQGTDQSVIESYMEPQDTAYVGIRRGAATYTFRAKSGRNAVTIAPASGWGVTDRDPDTVRETLSALFDAVREYEGDDKAKPAKTAGSQAGRIARAEMTETGQLPPRWRTLAHAAIHQGPTVCVRGMGANAVAWDRSAAFLRALFDPVPIRSSYVAMDPGAPFHRWAELDGFVRATVWIDPEKYERTIPPLPVRDTGMTIYPAGYVRGVWTIPLLSDAIVNGGAELVEAYELVTFRTEPIHAWAGETIGAIGYKPLRKLLYTRYWGRLASQGGYQGRTEIPDGDDDEIYHKFRGSDLFWKWTGRTLLDHTCPPDYRPDHSAYIASRNHVRMNEVIREVPRGTLVATHVDAIWTTATKWRPSADDFTVKGRGPVRFYGVGCYRHGDKVAAQGYEGPPLTPEILETWGGKLRNPMIARRWDFGQGPETHPGAVSDPPLWTDRLLPAYPAPESTVYGGLWTPRGWVFKPETEEDSE